MNRTIGVSRTRIPAQTGAGACGSEAFAPNQGSADSRRASDRALAGDAVERQDRQRTNDMSAPEEDTSLTPGSTFEPRVGEPRK